MGSLLGVRIDFPDPDHRVFDPDQLPPHVPLEHADLALVGGPHAVERARQQSEQPDVRHHEPGLPLLPRVADQGRAQDIHPQKRQQDREARAAVNVLLRSPRAIPRLVKRRIGQCGRQCGNGKDSELERGQESINHIDHPREPIKQRQRRHALPGARVVRRRRGKLLGGRCHIFAPTREGSSRGRNQRWGERTSASMALLQSTITILVGWPGRNQSSALPPCRTATCKTRVLPDDGLPIRPPVTALHSLKTS